MNWEEFCGSAKFQKFSYANRNSLLLELFEDYFLTIAIQEAAYSSLERADFQVLVNKNSAIFINQVQRTADRAARRKFFQVQISPNFRSLEILS